MGGIRGVKDTIRAPPTESTDWALWGLIEIRELFGECPWEDCTFLRGDWVVDLGREEEGESACDVIYERGT